MVATSQAHKGLLVGAHRAKSSRLRFALIVCLCVHHIYALHGVVSASNNGLSEELKRELFLHTDMGLRFFTIWNFIGQIVYIATELVLIFLPNTKYTEIVSRLSWTHMVGIITPSSLFVCSFFWTMYNYDRELILPQIAEAVLPYHLNHSVHTMILLLPIIEYFTSPHEYLPRLRPLSFLNLAYMLIYVSVLQFTYFWDNVWIYPFLGMITWPQRIGVYVLVYVHTQCMLVLGYWLQKRSIDRRHQYSIKQH